MKLLVNGMRGALLALTVGLASVMAGCGGGDPVVAFVPTRVLAFGDENSVITSEGRKYTVNALADVNGVSTLDCAAHAIWVQRLASSYGLVFPECNPNSVSDPLSRIYAVAGGKVADLVDQVDQHLATDTFSGKDLVTMFVGQNDVLELYAEYPASDQTTLLEAARQRGQTLAGQVSRVAAAGGKVLVSTVPDLSLSPFALAENTDTGDSTRSQFIRALIDKFDEGLRVGLQNEVGSEVAIMLTNELVQSMVKFPASYGNMSNLTDAVCDPALAASVELCTTETLVSGGTATSYLWADDTHLSPNGHTYVGSLAASRTRANPF